ncbi:MAG: chromate transporter [Betaproteobacteria bacterium RIFCSPLOWO2_12_FULL_62_13]|nr:MAG: chromate transporter [Betaproteobacteria bacterium RIFCSPLOWO2_12_FULL_62_13]
MPHSEVLPQAKATKRESAFTVFKIFLKLGCTSFGGPIAHLGYFREEFVNRRKWITDQAYADLVALCQFTPGPASSKVGIGIGLSQAGLPGAFAAWLAFTAPSALALILFGFGIIALGDRVDLGWLHGLLVVAVPVVAQAVWGMARNLTPDAPRVTLAALAAIIVLIWPTPLGFIGAIVAGGIAGLLLLKTNVDEQHVAIGANVSRTAGITALALFFGLLVALPALRTAFPSSQTIALLDSFYRAGSLVFGGGNVVLPLLQAEVGPPGWVSNEAFFAGYGAAQAVPGPLFTFAAYLGTVSTVTPSGWIGAVICLVGIFASSFLLVIGPLPFWDALRRFRPMRSALVGVNAAVVGMLLAFLYDPVWTNAIRSAADFGLALAAFVLLMFWKLPPWLVVVLTAAGGAVVRAVSQGLLPM